jgi:diaminohydroxyphosphoribosylaminopyrimidine deaminase/5-amino-6-(5-phosphoribosylamino)uracil reductase
VTDADFMRVALRLARRGLGRTSPNPMVGAVLLQHGEIIGQGWHRQAGGLHAEVEAIRDAERKGCSPKGATLYVTLEPCCTHGRTPPCTDAIKAAGIKRVVIGATDPNPKHAGRAFRILRRTGVNVASLGSARCDDRTAQRGAPATIADECHSLNESFNHWIIHRTPLVTVKAAMTLDGKIATKKGESKWITGEKSRAYAMKLRQSSDAILVGVNTVLADDPSLTRRSRRSEVRSPMSHRLRRIVLDSMARTPLTARVVADEHASLTTIVVSACAAKSRVAALKKRVSVQISPQPQSSLATRHSSIDVRWLLCQLGREGVTSLLVEGGGEVNASFLLGGLAHQVAFFYAPKILGGRDSYKAVAGEGVGRLSEVIRLQGIRWRKLGDDLLLTAQISS